MAEPDVANQQRASTGAIVFAVVATFIFAVAAGVVTGIILSTTGGGPDIPILAGVGVAIAWLVAHPFISRCVYEFSFLVFTGIDQVYDLQGDKKWAQFSPDDALAFGAGWPVTIFFTLFALIGLLFGWLYRSVWRD